ncbi:hypothetical protein FIV00_15180 [Labrenzia sp. THAF82]|nr:hypothetical protein FIV00_15180 [Labrenzia sp. THAF82]
MQIYYLPGLFGEHGSAALRFGPWILLLKAPWCRPLFSERYGYKPHYGLFGWRCRLQRFDKIVSDS